jgi:hypothetical protein
MVDDRKKKKDGVLAKLATSTVVLVVMHYFGLSLWIVMGLTFFVLWGGGRFLPIRKEFLAVPLAIQGGHMLWMMVPLYYRFPDPVLIDIFLLAGGLIWFYLRPGLWSASFLCLYQTLAVLGDVAVLYHGILSVSVHQAIVTSITWHGLALISLALLHSKIKSYAKVNSIENAGGNSERTGSDLAVHPRSETAVT